MVARDQSAGQSSAHTSARAKRVSIQALSWVLTESDASGDTRCIAIALANRFDAHTPLSCRLDLGKLAAEARTSRDTAEQSIDELVRELQELIIVTIVGNGRRENVALFPALLENQLGDVLAEIPHEFIFAGSSWSTLLALEFTAL